MDRIGKIEKIENDKYHIKTIPSEKCKKCNVCEAEQDIWLDVNNFDIKFKKGDIVKLKYEKKFSYLVFLIYILPVVFLIAGAFISEFIFDSEFYVVLSSMIMMGIGILIIKKVDTKFKNRFVPKMEKYELEDKEVI